MTRQQADRGDVLVTDSVDGHLTESRWDAGLEMVTHYLAPRRFSALTAAAQIIVCELASERLLLPADILRFRLSFRT